MLLPNAALATDLLAEVNRELRGQRDGAGGRPYLACLGPSQETPFWLGCLKGRTGKSDQLENPRGSLSVASERTGGFISQK